MRNKIQVILIISLSLFFSKSITAQTTIKKNTINTVSITDYECGTVATPTDISYMRDLWQRNQVTERNFLKNSKQRNKALINIPIKAHIIRTNAGGGGLSVMDLNTAITTMNGYYINANIQFYLCKPINYIDDSTYYIFNTNDETSLTRPNTALNHINIYFMNNIIHNGRSLCGYTFPPVRRDLQNIFMKNSCATNGSTLSHEMGHFFSLLHTHGKTAAKTDELVNGSNCATHGDEICDTPADPNLFGKKIVSSSCIYKGTAVDANSQPYSPDTKNIMSYSRFVCRTHFSSEQYARINSTAINNPHRNNYSCTPLNTVENTLKNQVFIYPNPNKGIVNVELGNLANVTIKVLNVTGQIVHAKEAINSKIYQFELNEATGIYFIEISTANDYQKFKLIKE